MTNDCVSSKKAVVAYWKLRFPSG